MESYWDVIRHHNFSKRVATLRRQPQRDKTSDGIRQDPVTLSEDPFRPCRLTRPPEHLEDPRTTAYTCLVLATMILAS